MTIVAISGGFDCLHKGHVNMIEEAAQYGRLHVYLNTDVWLMRKKGYVFMQFEDRARILMAMKGVELVIPVIDEDDTVCETIRMFKPDIFCNGGDRLPENTPELRLCHDLKIQVKFNVGGEKIQSSSELVKKAKSSYADMDVYKFKKMDEGVYIRFSTSPMNCVDILQNIHHPSIIRQCMSVAQDQEWEKIGSGKDYGFPNA